MGVSFGDHDVRERNPTKGVSAKSRGWSVSKDPWSLKKGRKMLLGIIEHIRAGLKGAEVRPNQGPKRSLRPQIQHPAHHSFSFDRRTLVGGGLLGKQTQREIRNLIYRKRKSFFPPRPITGQQGGWISPANIADGVTGNNYPKRGFTLFSQKRYSRGVSCDVTPKDESINVTLASRTTALCPASLPRFCFFIRRVVLLQVEVISW